MLSGLRVLDLSRVLAGPWAGQLLADLGADVVKVERPTHGDETRHWGPPFAVPKDGVGDGEAAYFLCANRGKRSIAVDFTTDEGQQVIKRLTEHADVLIENYKVGGLAQYGLDYESLSKLNPRLIYCSITGFGQTGPYKELPGYDFLIQGMSGLMSVTGQPDGDPGGEPMKVGVAVSDLFAGLYGVVGLLAALHKRNETNCGEHIDIGLFDVQVSTLANQALNYLVSGSTPTRIGNSHPNIVPYQVFCASDQYFILAVGNDSQFQRLSNIVGRPELASNPRFASNASRVKNRHALIAILTEIFATQTYGDWIEELRAARIPAGPINTIAQTFDDPQVAARNLRIDVSSPEAGVVPGVACPIKTRHSEISSGTTIPGLGQHTESVLADWLGLSAGISRS